MKRIFSIVMAAVLLCGMTVALGGSAGTAADPLISQSYLTGVYSAALRTEGEGKIETRLDAAYETSHAKLQESYDSFAEALGGEEGITPSGYKTLSMPKDTTLTVSTGASFVPLSGTATVQINKGTLVDVTTGKTVSSGSTLSLYHRYFCVEETRVTYTMKDAVTCQVDGSYTKGGKIDCIPTPQKIHFNGMEVSMESYNIGGYNFFKLRDIAYLMMGTGSAFSISFDSQKSEAYAASGGVYEAVGGELSSGVDNSHLCQVSTWTLYVDGKEVSAECYNIGGYNFFKLRDLGAALNFKVDYDYDNHIALIYSIDYPYIPETAQ